MNIQKAMRIRSELKVAASKLSHMIESAPYVIPFENRAADESELSEKRAEKLKKLDGLSYSEAVKRLFAISDACLSLNMAIEAANRKGHELLFKETTIKSKLLYVERLLEQERKLNATTTESRIDYTTTDAKGNFKHEDITVYNYPMIDDSVFGMSLVQLKKQLEKELEGVRDEISAFNATKKVDWEMPEELA